MSDKKASKKTAKKKTEKKADIDRRTIPHAERGKPVSGQTAREIVLSWDIMTEAEKAVVKRVYGKFGGGPVKVKDIAAAGFGDDVSAAKLKVRNAIRRLVQGQWLKNVDGQGTYAAGSYGKKHAAEAKVSIAGTAPDYSVKAEKPKAAPKPKVEKPAKVKPPKEAKAKPSEKAAKASPSKAGAPKGKKTAKKTGAKKPAKGDEKSPPVALNKDGIAGLVREIVGEEMDAGSKEFKASLIVMAAARIDPPTFEAKKVAALAGVPVGFVIPRLKRVETAYLGDDAHGERFVITDHGPAGLLAWAAVADPSAFPDAPASTETAEATPEGAGVADEEPPV